jgi:hypothetical protein
MSKVAVGCATLDTLRKRQQAREADGVVPLVTRFMPKRADELVGWSIYWIIKHRVVARQTILGFAQREADRRTIVRLDPSLVPVQMRPRPAHQGWRYLPADEAPADLRDGDDDMVALLPSRLALRLSRLALI